MNYYAPDILPIDPICVPAFVARCRCLRPTIHRQIGQHERIFNIVVDLALDTMLRVTLAELSQLLQLLPSALGD